MLEHVFAVRIRRYVSTAKRLVQGSVLSIIVGQLPYFIFQVKTMSVFAKKCCLLIVLVEVGGAWHADRP